jgi:hypothetical protein
VVRAQCLHRSLVLHRWLHGQGAPSVLRIGVRKEGAALKAHAWVELDGEVVYDDTNVGQGFAVLRPATGSTLRYLQQPTRSTVVSCESPSSAFHGN